MLQENIRLVLTYKSHISGEIMSSLKCCFIRNATRKTIIEFLTIELTTSRLRFIALEIAFSNDTGKHFANMTE